MALLFLHGLTVMILMQILECNRRGSIYHHVTIFIHCVFYLAMLQGECEGTDWFLSLCIKVSMCKCTVKLIKLLAIFAASFRMANQMCDFIE